MIGKQTLAAAHRLFRGRQNIVTSSLLREHGYRYQVAFGCSLPDLKEIAAQIRAGVDDAESPFAGIDLTEMAEALWADERIRESRMVAPMLYPRGTMTVEVAERWAAQIPTPEVADVVCMYAFQFGIGQELIGRWSESEQPMLRYCAQSLAKRLS